MRETIVFSGFEAHQHTGSFGGHRINLALAEKQLNLSRLAIDLNLLSLSPAGLADSCHLTVTACCVSYL